MNKKPYTLPALCLATVLLLAVALSGCQPAQAYEQASTAKIETAAMPSQEAPTESSDAGDEKEYPLTNFDERVSRRHLKLMTLSSRLA